MQLPENCPTRERQIGGKTEDGTEVGFTVNVPTPYATGHVCSEGEAAVLNQVLAENISNNLRAKLVGGKTEGEGDSATTRAYTPEEAQALVDEYVANYEPGVRRGGGEPRIVDPVEREAMAIAREKARELVKAKGYKVTDVDLPAISKQIFEGNRDYLMAQAKKIVDARNKASKATEELDFGSIDLAAAA